MGICSVIMPNNHQYSSIGGDGTNAILQFQDFGWVFGDFNFRCVFGDLDFRLVFGDLNFGYVSDYFHLISDVFLTT